MDTLFKQQLCLSCLECCKIILVPLADLDVPRVNRVFFSPEAMDFWTTRNCKPWTDAQGRKWLIVEFSCPYLCHITGCTVYENRPKFCRDYDGRKDPYLKHICKWKELND